MLSLADSIIMEDLQGGGLKTEAGALIRIRQRQEQVDIDRRVFLRDVIANK